MKEKENTPDMSKFSFVTIRGAKIECTVISKDHETCTDTEHI